MCKESTGINVMNRGFSRETDKRREQMVEKMVGTNKVERWFDVKHHDAGWKWSASTSGQCGRCAAGSGFKWLHKSHSHTNHLIEQSNVLGSILF